MKLSFYLLLILISSFSYSQTVQIDCKVLKDCKLKYLDGEDPTSYVVIKKRNHIEYHNDKKYYIKSKLNWLSDCEYNMTMMKITLPDFPFGPGEVMNVKFNKIDGDIVSYTATVRGHSVDGKFKIAN